MLGLKGFRSAAITLAGIELAHRIRKRQCSLPMGVNGRASSLKDSWAAALATSDMPGCCRSDRDAPMHQNSGTGLEWPRERPRIDGQVRYPRKISFGGSLYLLVRPQGGRHWHFHYRYDGKRKTLSLGTYPDVPTTLAQARHRAARRLLATGIDPSLRRRELRLMNGDGCAVATELPGSWGQAG
jgi:hypothetical protein